MKDKNTVRYIGFRSAKDGGRCFDFSVSVTDHSEFVRSFEIAALFFCGENRIRLQEGVGLCYAKLKHLLDIGTVTELPESSCLTRDDIAQYRESRRGTPHRKTA